MKSIKAIENAYISFIKQVSKDWILSVSLIIPFISGIIILKCIPNLEEWLCNYFNKASILNAYYPVFQLELLILPSYILSFISIMVVLDELDNGVAKYLCVTPLSKSGYIFTRFAVNSILVIPYTVIISLLFPLYRFSFLKILIISIIFSVIEFVLALTIVTLSKNKVEGLTLLKLISMLFLIAIPIPYIIKTNLQYLFSVIPTFWIAKYADHGSITSLILTVLCSLTWLKIFNKKFQKKII